MRDPNIQPYLDFVRPHYDGKDPAHDFGHILRIAGQLDRFSAGLAGQVRPKVLCFLAAFHGLNTKLREDAAFLKQVKQFLSAQGWSEAEFAGTLEMLRRHLDDPRSPEEKIVHDANYLEMLGAFGVAKAFTTGGARGQHLDETADIYENRYLDKVEFCTPEGQRAAKEGRDYAKQFLARLRCEMQQAS